MVNARPPQLAASLAMGIEAVKSVVISHGYDGLNADRYCQRTMSEMSFRDGIRRGIAICQIYGDAQDDLCLPPLQSHLELHALQ